MINDYLLTQGHSKLERYRTILGEDKDGNIVYTHNNYAPGDEEKLYQEIKKLSGK